MHETARPAGQFISLDGPDGGGKTTQVARLVEWLQSLGKTVVACRDPGGTGLGDRLRAILLDRSNLTFGMRAEMLMYMSSRAQLVDEIIRPALEAGSVVVSDRYLLANVVYQGHAGGLPVESLWEVGKAATGGLMPDLTLILDLPTDVARARVGAARDRMEDRSIDYHQRVRQGFLEAAATYSAPIRIIDASADTETIAAAIKTEVSHALALDPRT
jgi:dTMP kinase